jgi:alkanesulfonate monooxygenase SsuD/methylene tetrahydromethanopterin reductase-like flavin-dependent oxidoreductase (luciferase family)
MRVGLFYQIRFRSPGPQPAKVRTYLRGAGADSFAEQQGFESVWFSEHHFRPVWCTTARAGPDAGSGQPAHQPYPPRHRRCAGTDPSPSACRSALATLDI